MKKFFMSAFCLCLLELFPATAQDIFPTSIGPYIGMRAGVSAITTPKGRKNGLAVNSVPDFGFKYYVPFGVDNNLAFTGNVGYSTASYIIKSAYSDSKEYTFAHSYLVISPNFEFEGFSMGFNFNVPLAADIDGSEIDSKELAFNTEVKLGYEFPIFNDETGRLNIFVHAAYMLGGVMDNYAKNDPLATVLPAEAPQKITDAFNPRVASLAIGFNFLFSLNGESESGE